MKLIIFFLKSFLLVFLLFLNHAFSNPLDKIEIIGNDRISDETIKLFINVDIKDEINDNKLNQILKDLYSTDFFKDINLNFEDQTLFIKVIENPIIENISYNGVKSNRILDVIKENTSVKSRSSFNENVLKKEEIKIKKI